MDTSPRTKKIIALLFIGALLCGLGEYTAFNSIPYIKGKMASGYSALYAYAANQQLIAVKAEDSSLWGDDKKNGLALTPFCIWALLTNRFLKKLYAFSLPNAFLPKLSDFPGMLPLSLGPPIRAYS